MEIGNEPGSTERFSFVKMILEKAIGVIEYPKHKIQANVSDAIESERFFCTRD